MEQVFGAYGVPYSLDRALPFAHTGLGRGLLALIRCAAAGGHAPTTSSPTCGPPGS